MQKMLLSPTPDISPAFRSGRQVLRLPRKAHRETHRHWRSKGAILGLIGNAVGLPSQTFHPLAIQETAVEDNVSPLCAVRTLVSLAADVTISGEHIEAEARHNLAARPQARAAS